MKKSILASLFTIIFCLTMIVGVSYAAFTSSDGYTDNTVTTGSVIFTTTLKNSKNGTVDKITADNISAENYSTYKVTINNESTITTAYRTVFEITGGSDVVRDALFIKVNDVVIDFNSTRGTTAWVHDIAPGVNSTFDIELGLTKTLSLDYSATEIKFDFDVEMAQNTFATVSSQKDLDELSSGELAVLEFNELGYDELTLTTDAYLDLNGNHVTNLNVVGKDIETIELTNGTVTNFNADATNAVVYADFDLPSLSRSNATMNLDVLEFNYSNENEAVSLQMTVKGGTVVVNTLSEVSIDVVESTEESNSVVLVTTSNTVLDKVVINEGVTQDVVINNKNEIKDLVVESDSNVSVDKTPETMYADETFTYVSLEEGVDLFTNKDGVTYKNTSISFEDFLTKQNGVFYFASGTYSFNSTYVIGDGELTVVGLGNVVFYKENEGSSFTSYVMIKVEESATANFNNITFSDDETSGVMSSCLESYNVLNVVNCKFEGFAKNCITIRSGSALIEYCVLSYGAKSGAAGNGVQIGGSAEVEINYNSFVNFVSMNDNWSATAVLIYQNGFASVTNNTFDNDTSAICVTDAYSSADETPRVEHSDNITTNTKYLVKYETNRVAIVSEEGQKSYFYYDEENSTAYSLSTTTPYTNIQTAINESSLYNVIVLEGEYVVANPDELSNLVINRSVNLLAIGDVVLSTTYPGNSYQYAQSTVVINASDVVFSGFTVNATEINTNKAMEICGGTNILVQDNTFVGSYIYVNSVNVGNYYIIGNTVKDYDLGLIICNGAGDAAEKFDSVVTGNDFEGGIYITGTRTSGWDDNEVNNLPEIKGNTIGIYFETVDGVTYNGYLRVTSMNEECLLTEEEITNLLSDNTLTGYTDEVSYNTYNVYTEGSWNATTYYVSYGFILS